MCLPKTPKMPAAQPMVMAPQPIQQKTPLEESKPAPIFGTDASKAAKNTEKTSKGKRKGTSGFQVDLQAGQASNSLQVPV